MASRYIEKQKLRNANPAYGEQIRNRKVNFIDQFETPILHQPTSRQIASLERVKHVWKTGDRFFKLAHTYYGRTDAWWVIAQYNKKPTESHINFGDIIYIPMPLEKALLYMRYR